MKRIKINSGHLFSTVFILIGIATFRHSALGFASLEGSLFWAGVSALAIDVSMILFAHAIRRLGLSWSWKSLGLFTGMAITSLASIGTQLLFATTEAQVLEVAPGALWLGETAVRIINLRVVLLPALLPVLALVAALMGENEKVELVSVEQLQKAQAQLEAARLDAQTLRKQSAESDIIHSQTVERNRELAAFKAAVTDPDAWKTATSAARLVITRIFPNGNRPETKVLAELLKVSGAQIGSVARKAKAEQEVT